MSKSRLWKGPIPQREDSGEAIYEALQTRRKLPGVAAIEEGGAGSTSCINVHS